MKRLLLLLSLGQLVHAQAVLSTPPSQPPTWQDRRGVFFKRLLGPQAVIETIPGTIFDTARNFPHQWGRGPVGIAKRFGSQYGQFIVGEGIELGVSAFHREDPRYTRMPEGTIGQRIRHAIHRTFIVPGANGGNTIALARIANVYGSWAIATSWNPPDQRDPVRILRNGTMGMGFKVCGNLFNEFWPDVKRRLRRNKSPRPTPFVQDNNE